MLHYRFGLLLALSWLISTWAQAQEFPAQEKYPRVNGSTSTVMLGALLAARATDVNAQLRRLPSPPYGAVGGVQITLPLELEKEKLRTFLRLASRNPHTGTHQAYVALAENKCDLILVAREPSASEKALLAKAGLTLDMRPVAMDAFVFLVNVKNPVEDLSLDKIRSIYTGKTKLWNGLGGADFPIMALSRPRDSGSEELMDTAVMHGQPMAQFPPQTRISEMGGMIERVADNVNAIGYSVYYFERFMAPNPQNKLLRIGGVAPTPENIRAKTYPLTAPVWCVTRQKTEASSGTGQMRDWLVSGEGQNFVATSGYLPVAP